MEKTWHAFSSIIRMKFLMLFAIAAAFALNYSENPQPSDSLPLPGKTKPVIISSPPSPVPPVRVDTFYPSQPQPAPTMKADTLQHDDRDPGLQRGIFNDTIPK